MPTTITHAGLTQKQWRSKVIRAIEDYHIYHKAGFDPTWSGVKCVYDYRLFKYEWAQNKFYEITKAPRPPAGAKVFYL